ncbi:MAG TPA: ABC transporter substrate-binding protein, partial [Vicinamibacterales bacterium]|nr:ABC transporter substrate-binding protein [Vicinamibacterales bacterium]
MSIRSEPGTFNRFVRAGQTSTTDAITELTQASLVRIDRATDQLEPWLAESWTTSADGRVFTLKLRPGVTFSDGVPFTSADVLFSFRVLYDPAVNSVLAAGIAVQGKPLAVSAPDPSTVVITLPAPFAPGLRLLDGLPMLPRHQLQAALDAHTFADAWNLRTPPGSMAGLGPFVITGYVPGQQVTLSRNPHYWRRAPSGAPLPYLDTIVMDVVSSQDAEMLRLEAGTIDVMSQADLRPEDLAAVRRLQAQGALTLVDVGVGVDPNLLWFNLTAARAAKHDRPYLQRAEFRQAISCAVDRDAIARSVYLGAAVPIYGYVTPGNRTWYSTSAPTYPHDLDRARRLLASIGLEDRNHDGTLEDAQGRPVRFSIITQRANTREKIATVVQEQL